MRNGITKLSARNIAEKTNLRIGLRIFIKTPLIICIITVIKISEANFFRIILSYRRNKNKINAKIMVLIKNERTV